MIIVGILLGLLVAACWACTDITTTLASRQLGTSATTLLVQGCGVLALLVFAAPNTGSASFSFSLISIPVGFVAAGSAILMVSALKRGPLAVISPIMSGNGAITAIMALLFLQEPFSAHLIALPFILLGVGATTIQRKNVKELFQKRALSLPPGGVLAAIGAMIGWGILNFALGENTSFGFWLGVRCIALLFLLLFFRRSSAFREMLALPKNWAWYRAIGLAGLAGITEVAGLVTYRADIAFVSIPVAAMLASIYSLFSIVLGVFLFKERLSFTQLLGISSVLGGLVLLALI